MPVLTPNGDGKTYGLWRRVAAHPPDKLADLTIDDVRRLYRECDAVLLAEEDAALADADKHPDQYATASDKAGRRDPVPPRTRYPDPDPFRTVRMHYHELGGEA